MWIFLVCLINKMKLNSKLIIFLALFASLWAKETKRVAQSKEFWIIDSLLKRLELENWDHEESDCLQATTALLNGVKNQTLWATWIWNSMQLPVGTFYGSKYNFGNFDQCLQVPWLPSHPHLQMQYCLVDVKLTELRKYDGELTDPYVDAETYIGMESLHGRRLNSLSIGVCLPIQCKPGSIAKISGHIYQLSNLPFEDVVVDPRDCQVAGQKMEREKEFYVFWWIILVMVSICILVYFTKKSQTTSDSTVSKILRCFCLSRNFDALTEVSKDEIRMMHGMRAFTCGIITVAHCFLIINMALTNHVGGEKDMTSKYGRLLLHLDTCVDTFFVMSGLLHVKGLLSSRSSRPLKTLCRRYLRLIVPYALAVLCFAYVMPHLGSGPAWPRFIRKVYEPCAKSWWRNFLMMGNKVDGKEYCIEVSWYIHCDYQLTVLGTAIFILYQTSKRSGFFIFCTAYVISVITPIYVGYSNKLPAIVWYDFGESFDTATNKVFNKIYVQSYNRASSYLIGLAMGYLMTMYKPQDYRKTISKVFSILGFIVGFSLLVFVLHIGANSFDKEYSALATAVYATLDRSIWAVGICIIIAVCEYGTLPIINSFLSSKLFVPLSKLCFGNYLWHTVFIKRNMLSLRAPMSFDIYHTIINGLGYVVISNCFSYLFWLFIEAPSSNLINILFDYRTSKPLQNGAVRNAKHTNGVKIE